MLSKRKNKSKKLKKSKKRYTKKSKGGMIRAEEPTPSEATTDTDVVYSVFDPKLITVDKNVYRVNCIDEFGKYSESNYSEFTIRDIDIFINYLFKCNLTSGTSILKKIIEIAQQLKKQYVSLVDGSSIIIAKGCRYSLAHYTILLTGQSWYNKLGFISKDHDMNVRYNEEKSNLSLNKFIEEATINYKEIMFKKERIFIEKLEEFEKTNQLEKLDTSAKLEQLEKLGKNNVLENYKYVLENYTTLDNYEAEILKDIESRTLCDIDDFINAYHDLDIDKDTPISEIIKITHDTTRVCDEKMRQLIKLISCSNYVLKYNTDLVKTLM